MRGKSKIFKVLGLFLVILIIFVVLLWFFRDSLINYHLRNVAERIEREADELLIDDEEMDEFVVVADNLSTVWEIDFLPNGDILATEREGFLRRIGQVEGRYEIPDVREDGEGGLMGLAVHPDFEINNYVYLYYTTRSEGRLINRIDRFILDEEGPRQRTRIFEDIPGARFHNGGRIAFGPDGYLYVTVGDIHVASLSQDENSLAGKILRINDDGTYPDTNPFSNEVFSIGHRNPQGLAWDSQGRLWSTEHGASGNDELNLVERGHNFGWPTIEGDMERQGMRRPVIHSGRDTWAPAGVAYFEGKIYFGGLRGAALYKYDVSSGELSEHFKGQLGRIRAVSIRNGFIYIGTSNRDGRGNPRENDDKIIRIHPNFLD